MKKITFLLVVLVSTLTYAQQQQYLLDFEAGNCESARGNWTTFENPAPGFEILANPIQNGSNTSATTQVLKLTMDQNSDCYAGIINFHGTLGTWELDGAVPSNLTLSMDVNKSTGGGAFVGIKFANQTDGTLFEITDNQGEVTTEGVWETLTWDISAGAASGENNNIDQVVVFVDFTCGGGTRTGNVELLIDNITWGANKLTDCPEPTCDDGIQNGDETGIDCGGSVCDACIVDPTEAPGQFSSTGTDFYVYSGLSTNPSDSDFTDWIFRSFGGGVVSTDLDLSGNNVMKLENLDFFGSAFAAGDPISPTFNATGTYSYLHFDYYATTTSGFNFSLVDKSLAESGVCCGNPAEPFYKIGPGQDQELVSGQWVSVFIPLNHYSNLNSNWDGTDLQQTLITGNGTVYFDNIFFSTTNSLGVQEFTFTDFNVYPNPTQHVWNVKTNNINIDSIEVLDIQGRQVLDVTPNGSEAIIDASSLPAGLYFARINTPSGTSSIKLIKQ